MADEAGDGQETRTSGRSLKRWLDPTARDVDVITAMVDREIWRRQTEKYGDGWHPTPGLGKELDDDEKRETIFRILMQMISALLDQRD